MRRITASQKIAQLERRIEKLTSNLRIGSRNPLLSKVRPFIRKKNPRYDYFQVLEEGDNGIGETILLVGARVPFDDSEDYFVFKVDENQKPTYMTYIPDQKSLALRVFKNQKRS